MKVVQIIGQQNAGKTTLMREVIEALVQKGLAVGSIKHTSHHYELDKPGKDSFVHRQAGASPAAMVSGSLAAIYLPLPEAGEGISPETLLENPFYQNLDIVLIEGWIAAPFPKIEVFREDIGRDPLFFKVPGVAALITDDTLSPAVEAEAGRRGIKPFPRKNLSTLVAYLTC